MDPTVLRALEYAQKAYHWMLSHQDSGEYDLEDGYPASCCPECGSTDVFTDGHTEACEIGKLVAEGKVLFG